MANARIQHDWPSEEAYWRENYKRRPYVEANREYDFYGPGYRFGYEATERYPDKQWDDVEPNLRRDWDSYKYRGTSTWEQIKNAVRDAWDRITGHR
jgi:hypothetical protein